jgi:hypothetical protein
MNYLSDATFARDQPRDQEIIRYCSYKTICNLLLVMNNLISLLNISKIKVSLDVAVILSMDYYSDGTFERDR